jgi:hypothetical protein
MSLEAIAKLLLLWSVTNKVVKKAKGCAGGHQKKP